MRSLDASVDFHFGPHRFNVWFTHTLYPQASVTTWCYYVAPFPQRRFFRSRPIAFQPCRRNIVLQELRIPWSTYRVRLKVQKECSYIRKTIQLQLRNSMTVVKFNREH